MNKDNETTGALFYQMVAMFQMAALQQMGKLVNPLTNEAERNLEQAKASIDMLQMLQGKTAGNLDANEEEFLKKVLFELHMNYVDELKRPAEEGSGEEGQDSDQPDTEKEGG